MHHHPYIYIGDQAIDQLISFCRERELKKFLLVADQNTWRVLGEQVDKQLRIQGWDVIKVILTGECVDSDERSFMQIFLAGDHLERTYIAVGSGVITDATRFTSKITRNQFISVPTAASVDAYTPINAALTINGLKGSIPCQVPIAVFADLKTICDAPRRMTASGFSDLISKLVATAEWKLNSLLGNVRFDEEICARAVKVAKHAVQAREGIHQGDKESVRTFMKCQIESGLCMADFGDSSPAAGAEHQMEHLWGMLWYRQGKHGLMHGEAVGVGFIITTGWYEQLRNINLSEAEKRLSQTKILTPSEQETILLENLGPLAESAIQKNPIFFQLGNMDNFSKMKAKILTHWDEIQSIARPVPTPGQMKQWMKVVSAPTQPNEIGLSDHEVMLAREYAHFFRDRFTIAVLRKLLKIE